MESINILIVGVGGQGTVLASKILGQLFSDMGKDVKVSEVHGMSQRGGSVITFVRAGEKVNSPLIDLGCADVIISFELLEAQRYASYLKKGGMMIVNTTQIDPMPVVIGKMTYPDNITETLAAAGCKAFYFDAAAAAQKAGNAKAANVALLGAASRYIGGENALWEHAVAASVPPKFLEMNLKAFEIGRDSVNE